MKKWKHKICLLLCAAILLCACNAKEKTYETAYDYLTDHIADAAVLPDGTFAAFSELKEPNVDAISKMTLPFALGKYSEIQKFGEEEVQKMDTLLSLSLTGGDYEWI